mmetsp:Transcript_11842/g.30424  ORF Transcript_11842/g.30424 Transcript_11842/m.30424 type:complete len:243 (-) Transcript_11842:886-1614(-)
MRTLRLRAEVGLRTWSFDGASCRVNWRGAPLRQVRRLTAATAWRRYRTTFSTSRAKYGLLESARDLNRSGPTPSVEFNPFCSHRHSSAGSAPISQAQRRPMTTTAPARQKKKVKIVTTTLSCSQWETREPTTKVPWSNSTKLSGSTSLHACRSTVRTSLLNHNAGSAPSVKLKSRSLIPTMWGALHDGVTTRGAGTAPPATAGTRRQSRRFYSTWAMRHPAACAEKPSSYSKSCRMSRFSQR